MENKITNTNSKTELKQAAKRKRADSYESLTSSTISKTKTKSNF
jgi:hypothetical protein